MEKSKVRIFIDNSNIMSSYERATLQITSPTGKTISIYKSRMAKFTPEEKEVFFKFCKDMMVRFQGHMEATIEEMNILLKLSKTY